MPPRFTYWTIILEGGPTAFRAAEREELLPTLKQLQSRHPTAVMMWFARGRLWASPEEMLAHARLKRSGALHRDRGPAWRPGGEHRDPRDRFKKKPRAERRREAPPREARERRGPSSGGTAAPPRHDSRQRRPYRPTGGSRRGGGRGRS
jgi:hypothetical protein